MTDLTAPLPEFFSQTFITGMDVFIPATPAHLGLVRITVGQRGGGYERDQRAQLEIERPTG